MIFKHCVGRKKRKSNKGERMKETVRKGGRMMERRREGGRCDERESMRKGENEEVKDSVMCSSQILYRIPLRP
jgi:hypothetical protein